MPSKDLTIADVVELGRAAWNQRREAEGHRRITIRPDGPIERADLSGYCLRNAVIPSLIATDCNLSEADFTDSELLALRLVRCDFVDSDFTRANLDGAEIVGGRGAGASFIRATLTDAVFRSVAPYEQDDQEIHANELDLSQADFELAKADDVQFVGCDLAQAELRGIQAPHAMFQACDIRGAVFIPSGAEDVPTLLRRSDLRNVDFDHMCSLDNARFDDANLEHVSFMCRNVPGISLRNAVAQNATFQHCRFNEADFFNADLSNADLGGADLRTALGVTLDRCYTRDARLPTGDADPWSTFRSEYTGSRLMFNLIFLAIFVAPLVGKAVAMSGLNGVQQDLAERAEVLIENVDATASSAPDSSSMARAIGAAAEWPGPDFVEVPLGLVVLGVDEGVLYSVFVVVPVLAYQLLRAGLTWLVSRMSDDENQTGYSPTYRPEPLACPRGVRRIVWAWRRIRVRLRSYSWLLVPHRVTSVLFWLSLGAFAVHFVYWFVQPVWLPA